MKTNSHKKLNAKILKKFDFPDTINIANLNELSNEDFNKFVGLSNFTRNNSTSILQNQRLKSIGKDNSGYIEKDHINNKLEEINKNEKKSNETSSYKPQDLSEENINDATVDQNK